MRRLMGLPSRGVTTLPFDGSGAYSLPNGSTAQTGTTILSSTHNIPITDIASALSQVVLRSGVAPMSGNLNANGNKVTGLAAADTNGDAVRFEQAILTAPSAAQTITSTGLTLESTDAGATSGPDLFISRNSASPAANDYGGRLLFMFDDSAGNSDAFAALRSQALDVTSGSEDGLLEIGVVTGGAFAYEIGLTGVALYPVTNAGLDLGSGSLRFGATYTNTIELGNPSDTTLTRGAAGRLDVEAGAGSLFVSTIELGSESDTTLARLSSGDISVEGNRVYRAGGTDVPVADGGTGASTAAAGARALINGLGTTKGNILWYDGSNWSVLAPP